jgi:nucleoside-diphosphate-sugar epimerase
LKALVTGTAGFFGGILRDFLLQEGWQVVGVDVLPDIPRTGFAPHVLDIRDQAALASTVGELRPDAIFHCAAVLAHDRKNRANLWSTNVDGTVSVARAAARAGVPSLVFISSNCLWGTAWNRPVTEADPPAPIEAYGRSKLAAEQRLQELDSGPVIKILRCPTIIEAGRLGLLAILFQFIQENRRIWLVGDGANRYQFVNAGDLARACLLLASNPCTGVFNVGSDNVPTLAETFGELIRRAASRSRLVPLPRGPAVAALKTLYRLGLSPLGPYHYRMIAASFEFDTTRLRSATGWQPTVGNIEMLWRAYKFYAEHPGNGSNADSLSAHRRPAGLGALRIVKWFS